MRTSRRPTTGRCDLPGVIDGSHVSNIPSAARDDQAVKVSHCAAAIQPHTSKSLDGNRKNGVGKPANYLPGGVDTDCGVFAAGAEVAIAGHRAKVSHRATA